MLAIQPRSGQERTCRHHEADGAQPQEQTARADRGLANLEASVAAFEIWREERGRRPTQPLEEGVEPEEAKKVAQASAAS